jgi:protoporphyrinogen/coproporphyrinogen III oxidase
MKKVIIVGGGLSGLTVGYRLLKTRPDLAITILEERPQVGGNIGTLSRDGFRVETGPNGFQDTKRSTLELCHDLGLKDQLIPASEGSRKNRFLFLNEKIEKLPGSPMGILTTPLLSMRGKLSILMEPFRRRRLEDSDESVAAFARRRMGREAQEIFMDALVTGIHAGDPELLSVRAAFPRLSLFEKQFGSVLKGFLNSAKQRKQEAIQRGDTPAPTRMWSFREGLGVLVDALRKQLGDRVRSGFPVRRVEKPNTDWQIYAENNSTQSADAVVLTCPAYAQAELLESADTDLAKMLQEITYNKIAVVALGYREQDVAKNLDGFGYIAPQRTGRDILGVQWCSSIFPDRAPPGMVLWRVLCGGIKRADMCDLSDTELVRRVHAEMKLAQGVKAEPVFTEIVRWPNAIPQYNLGHSTRVTNIEKQVARHRGLFVTGNAFHGVAMNDVVEQAGLIAQRLSDFLPAQ